MKRLVLLSCALLALAAPATAQTNEEIIERAVLAAPAGRGGTGQTEAMVVTWDEDGTRRVLREGTNDFVCWDRSSQNGQRAFSVQCTNKGNLERYEQNLEFFRASSTPEEAKALMDAAEADGTRVVPVFGSVYYYMSGTDQESAGQHLVVMVPFATNESLGLPGGRSANIISVMGGGSSGAHLMVPGR
jgi:hypothetical protein